MTLTLRSSARLSKLLQGAAADAGATVDENIVTVDEKANKVPGQLVAQQPPTHKAPADKVFVRALVEVV